MPMWLRAAVLAAALTMPAAEPSVTLVDKPVTIAVAVPETARRAKALLLQLRQVIAPKSAAATFHIFADLPTADATVSVDHPNFVGYVTLVPNPSAPNNPPKGITIQVADPAARLIRTARVAKLTFVPMEKFANGGVKVGSIRLEPVAPSGAK